MPQPERSTPQMPPVQPPERSIERVHFTSQLTEAQREALPLVLPQRAYSMVVTAVPTEEDDPDIPQCEIAPHFTSQYLDEERGDAPRLLFAAPPDESAFKAPAPRDEPSADCKEHHESDYDEAPQSWYDASAFGMNPPGRSAYAAVAARNITFTDVSQAYERVARPPRSAPEEGGRRA